MWVVMLWARQHPWKKTLMQCQIYYGGWANKPIESHAGYTQRGGAYTIEASRVCMGPWNPGYWPSPQVETRALSQAIWPKWWHGPVEWKSGRTPRVTHGTAKLQRWVVGDPSDCQPVVEVPLILASRWSPYPNVQACGLGHCCYTPLPQSWHSTWRNCHVITPYWIVKGVRKVCSALALNGGNKTQVDCIEKVQYLLWSIF